jgi:hypothetical protein
MSDAEAEAIDDPRDDEGDEDEAEWEEDTAEDRQFRLLESLTGFLVQNAPLFGCQVIEVGQQRPEIDHDVLSAANLAAVAVLRRIARIAASDLPGDTAR